MSAVVNSLSSVNQMKFVVEAGSVAATDGTVETNELLVTTKDLPKTDRFCSNILN